MVGRRGTNDEEKEKCTYTKKVKKNEKYARKISTVSALVQANTPFRYQTSVSKKQQIL